MSSPKDYIEKYEKALKLKKEKGYAPTAISNILGVPRPTVDNWIRKGVAPKFQRLHDFTHFKTQNMPNEIKSYLAGIIDGDGNISLYKGTIMHHPIMAITNTDLEMLKKIQRILAINGIRGRITTTKPKKRKTKGQLRIIDYKSVYNLAKMVKPYLLHTRKKALAEITIKWIESYYHGKIDECESLFKEWGR